MTYTDTHSMTSRKILPTGAGTLVEPGWVVMQRSLLMGLIVCGTFSGLTSASAQERSRSQTASRATACWVAEFREMALTTHIVAERERKVLEWLSQYARQCSDEQLLILATNRPAWLGHADTARVAGAIDRELERRYVAGRASVERLFDSPAPRLGETQTTTTPEAPVPVVPTSQSSANVPTAVVVQERPQPRN